MTTFVLLNLFHFQAIFLSCKTYLLSKEHLAYHHLVGQNIFCRCIKITILLQKEEKENKGEDENGKEKANSKTANDTYVSKEENAKRDPPTEAAKRGRVKPQEKETVRKTAASFIFETNENSPNPEHSLEGGQVAVPDANDGDGISFRVSTATYVDSYH